MLFAQVGRGFGSSNNPNLPPEFWIGFAIFIVILIAISLTIQIFFLLTLSRCLSRISPRNRRMQPGEVWLNLIPCFGLIWIFFTVSRLADSLRDEFRRRQLHDDGDFGRSVGIAYPILSLVSAIPYIGGLFGIAALICMIIYWVKIAGYSKQLLTDTLDRAHLEKFDDEQQGGEFRPGQT
jgi:hypothetical protein